MVTQKQIESVETREQKHARHKYKDMYISREVIMSDAFRKLSGTAIRVYLFFLNKRVMKPFEGGKSKRTSKGKYYIENNGEIQFTYREAQERYGISRGVFRTAIDQLVEVGLIDIAKSSSGLHREVALYGISERWKLYGTDGFVVVKRAKRKQQYGFAKGNMLGRNAG